METQCESNKVGPQGSKGKPQAWKWCSHVTLRGLGASEAHRPFLLCVILVVQCPQPPGSCGQVSVRISLGRGWYSFLSLLIF